MWDSGDKTAALESMVIGEGVCSKSFHVKHLRVRKMACRLSQPQNGWRCELFAGREDGTIELGRCQRESM